MKLSEILVSINYECVNFKNINICGLSHNSKNIEKNYLFFAVCDGENDGREYIGEAIKNGAKAVVYMCDDRLKSIDQYLVKGVVFVKVCDVRMAMSIMAKNFYGRVDEKMKLVGVTGSNGKTTTASIIYEVLKKSNKKVGLIGTNGVQFGDIVLPSNMTTPDPIDLHYFLSQMYAFGVEYVVMEVSAHAIFYQKIAGLKFDVGVFTNISNEHLDFFKTMENYAHVKASFFVSSYVKECVVNIDDDLGMKIAYSTDVPCVSFGLTRPANIFAVDIKMTFDYMSFIVNAFDDIYSIKTHLIGDYNVYNIMASIGACRLLGIDDKTIKNTINSIKNIEGRWMTYDFGANKKIIVDFAHTPDGFEKVLSLVKNLRKGKLTTLFGCVGYSDSVKRKMMGQVASKYSDRIVLSSDNPCDASFDSIVSDIKQGITCECIEIEDREKAIKFAFDNMVDNETLIILGKGAEKYQKVKGAYIKYSDIDVVNKLK